MGLGGTVSAVADLKKGARFGMLVVQAQGDSTPRGAARWWCLCDCGKRVLVMGRVLRSGMKRSCGCKRNVPDQVEAAQ
jgi:hypothetical protein